MNSSKSSSDQVDEPILDDEHMVNMHVARATEKSSERICSRLFCTSQQHTSTIETDTLESLPNNSIISLWIRQKFRITNT